MAFCSKCGAQVGEGDLFCSTCGAKAAAPEVATPPVFDIERKGQQIDEVGRHQMVALIAGAVGVVLIIVGLALGLMLLSRENVRSSVQRFCQWSTSTQALASP
jgi:uncharacterized membrane protein YvbJ